MTTFSAAASKGHLETVRELLQHGSSVDIADKNGRTPLKIAASEDHLDTVRDLLQHGPLWILQTKKVEHL